MYFELAVDISRPPADVFIFLRDKDQHPQKAGSPVLALDRLTPGPPRVGACYREIVQMLPGVRGEIRSVITRYEPHRFLEEDFYGAGMAGHLAYEFAALPNDATRLIQRQTVEPLGCLRTLAPLMRLALAPRLRSRLAEIKAALEGARVTPSVR